MVSATYRYIYGKSPKTSEILKAAKKLQSRGIRWVARDIKGRVREGEGEWHIPYAQSEGLSIEDILSSYTQMLSGVLHASQEQIGHDYEKYLDRCNEIESKLRVLLDGSILYEGDNGSPYVALGKRQRPHIPTTKICTSLVIA